VLADYLPIVILMALAFAFGVLSMVVSRAMRPHHPNPVKLSAYECGIEPERLPEGERFSVKFYLVAMLFIIFDVETVFLFVWAVALRSLGVFGLVTMAIFIALLFVVEGYVWMAGGFEWERPPVRRPTAADSAAMAGPDDTDDAYERRAEATRAG
jgi:NADH-quinone oxidoreductase subunit A